MSEAILAPSSGTGGGNRATTPWVRIVMQDEVADEEWQWRLDLKRAACTDSFTENIAKVKQKYRFDLYSLAADVTRHIAPGYHRLILLRAGQVYAEQVFTLPLGTCYQLGCC